MRKVENRSRPERGQISDLAAVWPRLGLSPEMTCYGHLGILYAPASVVLIPPAIRRALTSTHGGRSTDLDQKICPVLMEWPLGRPRLARVYRDAGSPLPYWFMPSYPLGVVAVRFGQNTDTRSALILHSMRPAPRRCFKVKI